MHRSSSFMTSRRLEQQYLRLLDIFPAQTGSTTLQELADKLHYSKRHMRSLLVQMQTLGWVDWLSVAGRGHRSQLNLLRNSHQMLVEKADKLIDEGSFDEALSLLGEEKQLVTSLLRSKLGYSIRNDYQSLSVPYYRTMPNLTPALRCVVRSCILSDKFLTGLPVSMRILAHQSLISHINGVRLTNCTGDSICAQVCCFTTDGS